MDYNKEGLPKTKMFFGENYRLHDSYLNYDEARWQLGKLRSDGWKAWMAKVLGLFAVYKRR